MRNEALRWLGEAEWDYETALILHREKRYNASAFYAHQAAEKAVKALLYSINEAPWGHSIRVLLERYFKASGKDIDEKLLSYARELDRHYIPSRYPNAHPEGTPHEAYDEETSRRALQAAKTILDFVKEIISEKRGT
ncbi:MAG: HEPN domain-containing protein [Thermoprotei archaeon]